MPRKPKGSPVRQGLPNPLRETIAWCERNKPDAVAHLFEIEFMERTHQEKGRACAMLMTLAFQAGRKWQANNPDNLLLIGE